MFTNLDYLFSHWLNHFSNISPVFNKIQFLLSGDSDFKGLPFIILFWMFWFSKDGDIHKKRSILLRTFVGCIAGLFICRLFNDVFPNRLRPALETAVGFNVPVGIDHYDFLEMTSFPSDHATLFFGLALGFFFLSKRLGVFLMIYVSIFIAFPRMYLGYHFLSDIIVGALLGLICVYWAIRSKKIMEYIVTITNKFENRYPGIFYACLFVFSIEIYVLFSNIRVYLHIFLKYI